MSVRTSTPETIAYLFARIQYGNPLAAGVS